jgi:hypothetical protein
VAVAGAARHAVLGQLPEAERSAREARARMTAARAEATMLVHDTLLAARSGRFGDVLALTGTSAASQRMQHKLLRVLRAWALRETGGSAEEARMLLDGTRPVVPGELAYLAGHWAELHTYLVESGLGDAATEVAKAAG